MNASMNSSGIHSAILCIAVQEYIPLWSVGLILQKVWDCSLKVCIAEAEWTQFQQSFSTTEDPKKEQVIILYNV